MDKSGAQTPYADNDVQILTSRYRNKLGDETYNGKNYGYEIGSCDMTSNPNFIYYPYV